jgi:prevent-host-death family protein
MNAPVRELKARLSHYLNRAAAGEEITVTSRGRPIARLVPPAPEATDQELSSAELRRRLALIPGIIMGKGGKPRGSTHPIRLRKGAKPISQTVLEDRR